MAAIIEIINNTRGGIEGKIGERGVWGGKFKSRMFTHSRYTRRSQPDDLVSLCKHFRIQ